jgi:hypothetical protein
VNRRRHAEDLDSIEACAITLRLVAREFEAQERVATVAREVLNAAAPLADLRKALSELDQAIADRKAAP